MPRVAIETHLTSSLTGLLTRLSWGITPEHHEDAYRFLAPEIAEALVEFTKTPEYAELWRGVTRTSSYSSCLAVLQSDLNRVKVTTWTSSSLTHVADYAYATGFLEQISIVGSLVNVKYGSTHVQSSLGNSKRQQAHVFRC